MRKALGAAGVLILVGLVILVMSEEPPSELDSPSRADRSGLPAESRAFNDSERFVCMIPTGSLIDRFDLEPAVACVGDWIIATTDAPGADDVDINGGPGSRRLFRAREEGSFMALARAFDGHGGCEARTRTVRVADCGDARVVVGVSGDSREEVAVRVLYTRGLSEPIEWTYDLGDGTTAVTGARVVHHRYEPVEVTRTVRISVLGRGAGGEERSGQAILDVLPQRDDLRKLLAERDREMEPLRQAILFVEE